MRRQVVDVDEDALGGILGEIGVGGEDDRHRLADIAHLVLRQDRLAVGLEAGDADLAEIDRRDRGDVGEGPHRRHAGHGQGLARLDAEDAAVGDRRADDAHVELAGKIDVGGEAALSGEKRPVLQAPYGGADDGHQRILSAAARTASMMFW